MAVYQNTVANLGVRLTITHAAPNISGNSTTITYKAEVYKTGSYNPWNNLNQTPMYLTINGVSLHSTSTGNYDLRGGTTAQTIKSGTLVIPHDADGSKTFSFSWRSNFTSTGYGYGDVTTSGSYALPTIPRASTFSVSTESPTTGSNFTVTISPALNAFRHDVSYIINNSETISASEVETSATLNIPHSVFNANKDVDTIAAMVRVRTYNGTTLVGTNTTAINVNLVSSAIPSVSNIENTNSNKGPFSSDNQYIRGVSKMTVTSTGTGSYSSTISSYEYRLVRGDTSANVLTVSKTSGSHTYDVFDFPASGSITLQIQARVRDSRGRYSAWTNGTLCRLHYYQAPAIGSMTVRRVGANETTLQVTRNYNVTNLYEGEAGTNKNTAALSFQHRTKGTTAATNNTGAESTTMSLVDSNANLALAFASNTSYEVRAVLKDSIQTVYSSWLTVGTVFVPFDIGPKGAGVGKAHSDGSYDLEVGSGGATIDGSLISNGIFQASTTANLFGMTRFTRDGIYNQLGMGAYYGPSYTNDGAITLTMPSNHNGMFSATISIRSYNYSAVLEVSGYTYTISTGWHSTNMIGNIEGNDVNVRFRSDGANARYITIGETTTQWGGHLQVTVENVKSGHGGAFPSTINVSLRTSWPGNVTNSTFYLRKLFHTGNDGSDSGLDADLLDGLHASSFMRSNVSIPTVTSGINANGNWYNINGVLLICWYRFSITNKLANSQMNGSWTYPMPFAFAPAVSIGSRADSDPNSTNGYRRAGSTAFHQYNESATKTDILYAVNNNDVPASPQKYLNIFAMGTPA